MRQHTTSFLFLLIIFYLENHTYTFIMYIITHYKSINERSRALTSLTSFKRAEPSRAEVPEECDEDREKEEEEEDPNLLGAHGPARRCCAGAAALAGYANGGLLPLSRCASTPSRVQPGTPH